MNNDIHFDPSIEKQIEYLQRKLENLETCVARLWLVLVLTIAASAICLTIAFAKRSYPRYHACANGVILDVDTGDCFRAGDKSRK